MGKKSSRVPRPRTKAARSRQQASVSRSMHKFAAGRLHSGPSKIVVRDRDQALAIALHKAAANSHKKK